MFTQILAHRGASAYAPENTMAAFNLAKEMKADGLELDVHLTKDGQLVVTHDETIERCSDAEGWLKDYTYDELKDFNFGAKFDGGKWQEPLPLLSDVLELVRPTNMVVNIELKNSVVLYPELEEKTLTLVRAMKLDEQIIYSSFNHYSIAKLKQLGTASLCGLLYAEPLFMPWQYAKMVGADALHPHFLNLQIPNYMDACRELGIRVHPWTVDEEKHLAWMYQQKAEAIITNKPDLAFEIRSNLQR